MSANPHLVNNCDGARRTGAVWVAGTGAGLLAVSAALFIAVRWDQLSEAAKLGVVFALTGAFLLGGRVLSRRLPATGDVLFHLGAFLLPIDLAGIAVHLQVGWRVLLLGEGLMGTVVLGALSAASGSVVMGWAATASVAVLAAGVAAVSPIPAPLALAMIGTAAHLGGRRRHGIAWAAVAGLAPLVGVILAAASSGFGTGMEVGVLRELGLAGRAAGLAAAVSGALAAGVLAREAHARRDLTLAGLALVSAMSGWMTAWLAADLSQRGNLLALPAAFLLLEALALAAGRDPFWARPVSFCATAGEVAAGWLSWPLTLGLVASAPWVESGVDLFGDAPGWMADPARGVSLGLLALGWLAAGARRRRTTEGMTRALLDAFGSWAPLVVPAAISAVVVGTASAVATAAASLALAAVLARSTAVAGRIAVPALALLAPLVVWQHPLVALPIGLAAAAILAQAAVTRAKGAQDGRVPRESLILAAVATAAALIGCALGAELTGDSQAFVLAVAAAWGLAGFLDRAGSAAGDVARVAMAATALLAGILPPATGWMAPVVATLAAVTDAIRLRRPAVALAGSLAVQIAVFDSALLAGLHATTASLALCASAILWAGLALVGGGRTRPFFLGASAAALAFGLVGTAGDPRLFADALLITGGLGILGGLVAALPAVSYLGGAVAIIGLFGHLTLSDVRASEAYLAPVALEMLVAGWDARRRSRLSSWVTYTPAVALLGGAALAERIAGGAGWHALIAGAVAIAAVAAGGGWRLVGPLVVGSLLLGAVTVNESLVVLAGTPTWAWLAAGGALLLGLGIALERAGTTPGEASRRLVDVVAERFQ